MYLITHQRWNVSKFIRTEYGGSFYLQLLAFKNMGLGNSEICRKSKNTHLRGISVFTELKNMERL